MALGTPGFATEQKVVTVANNDSAINAEITTQSGDDWLMEDLFIYPDGTNVILSFVRTVATSA